MIETTLCYLEKDGCYLMLHRIKKEQDVNKDKWIGVGGKLLPAETPLQCACREILEETGLTVTAPEYRGIVDFSCNGWPDERMHLFWTDTFTGTVKECNEGVLEWVPIEQVHQLPQWEGDRLFLKRLQEKAPFFHLKLSYHGDKLVEVQEYTK